MSLNAQQKDALAFQLLELVNHDEPNAFLVTLHRIAEREAFAHARRDANLDQALSWQTIADAVARVRLELLKSQLSRNPT
jgi:NAD-dependent oxidoreductase involved in siderophore biosynthesis